MASIHPPFKQIRPDTVKALFDGAPTSVHFKVNVKDPQSEDIETEMYYHVETNTEGTVVLTIKEFFNSGILSTSIRQQKCKLFNIVIYF